MIQQFFFLGTLSVPQKCFDDHKNVLCISKNEAQYVYAYDNALKFSIFKENHSLKQTETPTCLFHL